MAVSPQISPERAAPDDSRPHKCLFHDNLPPSHGSTDAAPCCHIVALLCQRLCQNKCISSLTEETHLCCQSHYVGISSICLWRKQKKKLCKVVSGHRGMFCKINWTLWRLLRRDVMQIPPVWQRFSFSSFAFPRTRFQSQRSCTSRLDYFSQYGNCVRLWAHKRDGNGSILVYSHSVPFVTQPAGFASLFFLNDYYY